MLYKPRGSFSLHFTSKQLAIAGLLIAMEIIFTRFFAVMIPVAGVGGVRLGLGPVPVIVGGLMFGPVLGGAIGGVADIIGYLMNPFGAAFNPFITLASVMYGVIPPLMLTLIRSKEPPTILQMGVAITATQLVSSLLLTTYGLQLLYGIPFIALLPARLVANVILIPSFTAVCTFLYAKIGHTKFVEALRESG